MRRSINWNATVFGALLVAPIFVCVLGASARAGQQQIAASGAWRAVVSTEGVQRTCFVVTSPTSRVPSELKRDPGYLFVSLVRGKGTEISSELGYRLADAGHFLTIEQRSFELMSSNGTVWLKSPSDESEVSAAMRAGRSMEVAVRSGRGNATTDTYDLTGFSATLEELKKRCRP